MNNVYSQIPTYEQCLEIVADCKAFSHSTQEVDGNKVESFKYNIVLPGMWDGFGRLNMRGITFVNGELGALPFPKFFNCGEHENSTNVDFTTSKYINEKIDGSLISVFEINGKLYLKTMKSVYSDVAKWATENVTKDVLEISKSLLDSGLSPIFEYVSPQSRVVLSYDKPDFYFLGARSMSNGAILFPEIHLEVPSCIKVPKVFASHEEMSEYVEKDDVEGVVVTLDNGIMVKVKSADYCRIHRILSNFTPKNIVENFINNTYDDMIGVLTFNELTGDVEKARKVAEDFLLRFDEIVTEAEEYYNANKHRERKDIALELMGKGGNRPLGALVFRLIDGKEINTMVSTRILEESKEWNFS